MEQIKQFEPGFTLENAETIENKRTGVLPLIRDSDSRFGCCNCVEEQF
jgi:hypothetical protein